MEVAAIISRWASAGDIPRSRFIMRTIERYLKGGSKK